MWDQATFGNPVRRHRVLSTLTFRLSVVAHLCILGRSHGYGCSLPSLKQLVELGTCVPHQAERWHRVQKLQFVVFRGAIHLSDRCHLSTCHILRRTCWSASRTLQVSRFRSKRVQRVYVEGTQELTGEALASPLCARLVSGNPDVVVLV